MKSKALICAFSFWYVLPTCAQTAPSSAPPNLLTQNSDFEAAWGGGYNGTGKIAGWLYRNKGYKYFGVSGGGKSSEKCFALTDGGNLETAPDARAPVAPHLPYRLRFDARKTRDAFPQLFIGLGVQLHFYDEKGKFLNYYRPPEFLGEAPGDWQALEFACVAPAGAASAGVLVDHFGGQYLSAERNYTNARDVQVDNFRLEQVVEAKETAVFRRAPRLVEPSKTVPVSLRTRLNSPRELWLSLSSKTVRLPTVKKQIAAGRITTELSYPLPSKLANGTGYSWKLEWAPRKSGEKPVLAATQNGVIVDQTVAGKQIMANDPRLNYEGRWNLEDAKKPSATWPGSALHGRFKGTTLRMTLDVPKYQNEKSPLTLGIVVNGDEANFRKIALRQGEAQTITLAEGLPLATHNFEVLRVSDIEKGLWRVQRLETDGGWMRAEPLPLRKIEFFGDSITEGGTTDPKSPTADPKAGDRDYDSNPYFTFAAVTARALGAQRRLIAKGGMAISGPAFVPFSLGEIWDKADFEGDVKSAKPYNLSGWQPDAVVIGIGHNDLFSKGYSEEKFAAKYADFVSEVRKNYPNAHIFCTDTTMTFDSPRQWERAVLPLIKNDPRSHLNLFTAIETHGGHPHRVEHRQMALGGGAQLNNLSDFIAETMGW